MFCVILETVDPAFNLAVEEILFKRREYEYLILYINSPSVILGKHQSPHKEINTKYIFEKGIDVIRRISGGGTVYHDYGNLNFTFIKNSLDGKQVDFKGYTTPVIDFLSSFGIRSVFEGNNDLKVDGYKISGNAEHVYRNRVLHHGTLLFNSSLDMLRSSIRNDKSRYVTRAVDSNPSSVANLRDKISVSIDINEFKSRMMNYFLESLPDAEVYKISTNDIRDAEHLAETKYRTWEWNYAYGPEYNFKYRCTFNGHEHNILLFVKDGIIRECHIEGSENMKQISGILIGCRHMVSDMLETINHDSDLISKEDIFKFF